MKTHYDPDALAAAADLPAAGRLPRREDMPDVLTLLDGTAVREAAQWPARRAELKTLFQHYMYGYFPPPPAKVHAVELFCEPGHLDGAATLKEIELSFDESPSTKLRVLMAVPNAATAPPPIFVGVNFGGNASLVDDPRVALPTFLPKFIEGVQDNRPGEGYRGARASRFPIERIIARGYALACFYHGDIDPDKADFSDGVQADYYRAGQSRPTRHEWGTLAAWAWGLSRVVDYLQTDASVDAGRIASVGHSRNGKTSLLAAAFDERIKLAVVVQAGCGGSAPSRTDTGETLSDINKMFPHWFCDEFKDFSGHEDRLPFDQHALIALCAPRAVLLTNAEDDAWANPAGQFEMLRLAAPVYAMLGVETPLARDAMPPLTTLVPSTLGYWIRPGKHAMGPDDWAAFMDYADRHL